MSYTEHDTTHAMPSPRTRERTTPTYKLVSQRLIGLLRLIISIARFLIRSQS